MMKGNSRPRKLEPLQDLVLNCELTNIYHKVSFLLKVLRYLLMVSCFTENMKTEKGKIKDGIAKGKITYR